jgi:flagellar protein FliJ
MAKKFNFKLESVLKYRADKVSQAIDSLNQAVKIRIEKQKEINDTESRIIEIASKFDNKTKARDLQVRDSHIVFLNEEILRLEQEKKQIIEIESIRRLKLTRAMKDEKVLEKLKEKKLETYNEELKKEEGLVLDEIGLRISENKKESSW